MKTAACLLLTCALLTGVIVAQQPGPNVNVLPSFPNGTFAPPFPPPVNAITDSLRGDGYLQRQVEPAIAVSTYNPDHILAAFGDFRTTAIPNDQGLPEDSSEGWLGLTRSYDRGHTWFGSMVPGFPKDTSTVGINSPVHLLGYQAATDAVIATTPGGHFYVAGLFFTRDKGSAVAVAHYRDLPDTDGGDTIRYQGMKVIGIGSLPLLNTFLDKPSIASDIARGTKAANVCGPVYVAWTIFDGQPDTTPFSSRIAFSTAEQGHCGTDWDRTFFISQNFKQNQGTAMAVDPNTGKIYLVWRHVAQPGGDGLPDGIVMVTSTNRGVSFSAPKLITPPSFAPFDQPSIPTSTDPAHPTFRSNAFPTIAVDSQGNVYVATQEKTSPTGGSFPAGYYEPRIVIRTSRDGGNTWAKGSIVDPGSGGPAQQFMPTMTFAGGLLKLMWYDFRGQNQPSDSIAGGFFITGLDRQVKTYVAQSNLAGRDANGNPAFAPSVPVTIYLTDPRSPNQATINVPGTEIPAVNRPNLPTYAGGTTPFLGDYIGMSAAAPFVANPGGATAFRWATSASDFVAQPTFGVWSDTRDVVFPSNGGKPDLFNVAGWQIYAPPGTGLSCVNPGARDANVYFSEIKPGVIAGSPATSRQLVTSAGAPIERAFPIYVENPNSSEKFFRLTFNSTAGVAGSFTQGAEITGGALTQVDLDIVPFSSASTTVYVFCPSCTSANAFAPFNVTAREIDRLQGSLVAGGAATTVFLNSDPTAPFVLNPQLATTEIHNATVSNPQFSNPQYSNPQYSNPQFSNPQYSNPQYSNPQYSNPQYSNVAPPDIAPNQPPVGDFVWTVQNVGNNASAYTSLTNVAIGALGPFYTYEILVARSYNSPLFNGCAVQPIPVDQVISIIPKVQFTNPQFSNPQYSNPQFSNPQYSNASFAAVPPPPGSSGAALIAANTTTSASGTTGDDGTIKMPRLPDTVYVVLRVFRTAIPPGSNVTLTTPLTTAEQQNFVNNISQVVFPQAANTGQPTPQGSSNKAFSTTVLTANGNTSTTVVAGQPVALAATVAPQSGTGTPTGTVTFQEGSSPLLGGQAVPLVNGQATLNISSLGVGTHTITSNYSGDANFNFSVSGSVTVVVTAAGTTTVVTSDSPNNTSVWGQQVTFTATVTPTIETIPTGTVAFYLDSNPVGGTPAATVPLDNNGRATFTPPSPLTLPAGSTTTTHTVTAVYSPDTASAGLAGSTSPALTQTVNNFIKIFTATPVTASPNGGARVDPFTNPASVDVFGSTTLTTGCSAMSVTVAGSSAGNSGFVVDNYVTLNLPAGTYDNTKNICTGPHSDTFTEGTVLSCFQRVTSNGNPTQLSDYVPEPPIAISGAPLNFASSSTPWVTNTFVMTDIGSVLVSSDVYLVVTNCTTPPPPSQ